MYKPVIIMVSGLLLGLSSHGSAANCLISKEEYPIHSQINTIHLSGYNGSITWVAVDSPSEARVVVEKVARRFFNTALTGLLAGIKIEEHSSDTQFVLKAIKPQQSFGLNTTEVRFVVYALPEQIREFYAQTSNGPIKIEADFSGLLDLKTSNGSITLRSGTGEVTIKTSNGAIDLGSLKLTNSSTVRTSNGHISGSVAFPATGKFLFQNSNGNINLKMPLSTQATFTLATSNGTIDFQLGEKLVTKKRKVLIGGSQHLSTEIKTSNGNLIVRGD